jgi:hypothetical protein
MSSYNIHTHPNTSVYYDYKPIWELPKERYDTLRVWIPHDIVKRNGTWLGPGNEWYYVWNSYNIEVFIFCGTTDLIVHPTHFSELGMKKI